MEQQQIFKMKYPTWTEILSSFGNKEVYRALAKFLFLIIGHTEGLFKSATERLPNFPILRQWAYYEKECQAEDDKSLKLMCEKIFPNHSAPSPGLMVMTRSCPTKVVCGISLMASGESPQMIFDVIM